jgi:hypothetical protein
MIMYADRPEVYPGTVTSPEITPEALTALADALRGRAVEGVRIHDVMLERDFGIDYEPWLRVTLLLDDPRPGQPTWPVAAMEAISRTAREAAWELGIPTWLRLSHVSISEAGDVFPPEAIARARAAAA